MVRILYYSQSTHYGLLQNLQHTHMEFMLTKVGIHGFEGSENQNFNVYAGVKSIFNCNSSEKSGRCFTFQFVYLSLWDIRTNTESVACSR